MPDDFDARDDHSDHGGWADEDMPEEDDYRPPELPWPAVEQRSRRDAPPRRWPARYGVPLVLTAVIAAVAGFLAVVAVRDLSARPAAANSVAPASGPAPSAGVPAPGGGTVPGPGSGQAVQLEIGGKVTAVSATSITVTGPDHQVTAAVTSATKVTGRVTGIGGVKAGDQVSMQATGTEGNLTATAIQDPASLP
jgi:hypothetical protein